MEGRVVGVQGEGTALEIYLPLLECMDDGKEFLFVGRVVAFGGIHLTGGECDRLGSTALVLLEDSADGEAGCVSGDDKGKCRVWDAENRSAGECGSEGVEGGLGLGGPCVQGVFVRELSQGCSDAGVMGDETAVVVTNAQK